MSLKKLMLMLENLLIRINEFVQDIDYSQFGYIN